MHWSIPGKVNTSPAARRVFAYLIAGAADKTSFTFVNINALSIGVKLITLFTLTLNAIVLSKTEIVITTIAVVEVALVVH